MSLAMVGRTNALVPLASLDSLSFQPVFNWPRFTSESSFGTRNMKFVVFLGEHTMPIYIYIYIYHLCIVLTVTPQKIEKYIKSY